MTGRVNWYPAVEKLGPTKAGGFLPMTTLKLGLRGSLSAAQQQLCTHFVLQS